MGSTELHHIECSDRLLYYSALLCSTLLYHHHGKVVRRLKTEGLARARSHTTADVQHLAST